MKAFQNWDEMLKSFKALGGIADNVIEGSEHGRRGLFVIDPSKPFNIELPFSLQVPVDAVTLEAGNPAIDPAFSVSDECVEFFCRYNRTTSWFGGKEDIVSFIESMKALPEQIKDVLRHEFKVESLWEQDSEQDVLRRFIYSRAIIKGPDHYMMPILELANHSPSGIPYTVNEVLSLSGRHKSEILANYSASDSWTKFCDHGAAIAERYAFSQRYEIQRQSGSGNIQIGNDIFKSDASKHAALSPIVTGRGNDIDCSFLILGDRLNPATPKSVFDNKMKAMIGAGGDEFFESILYNNKVKFFKLLAACEIADSPLITTIRQVCRYQLEAIAHCILNQWEATH